jgi:hypothetical protein
MRKPWRVTAQGFASGGQKCYNSDAENENTGNPLGDRLVVGQQTLDLHAEVRILVPQLIPGGFGGVEPPVPFPNTAVKRPSADDTERAIFWENRSLPGITFVLHVRGAFV